MQHLSLPDRLSRVWKTSVGEGASRYTRVLSQPVVAKGRVYAMDGGVQVSALDAGTGNRLWQVDLRPDDEHGNSFGGGVAFWAHAGGFVAGVVLIKLFARRDYIEAHESQRWQPRSLRTS